MAASAADLKLAFQYDLGSFPHTLFDSVGLMHEPQKSSLADSIWKNDPMSKNCFAYRYPTLLLSPIFQLQMSFHLLHPPCSLREPKKGKTYFLFAYMTHLWERHTSLGACSNMDLNWPWEENGYQQKNHERQQRERKAKTFKH